MTALAFGFLDTAEALARRGAPVEQPAPRRPGWGASRTRRACSPPPTAASKHIALALAAQHGHAEVVRLLLDAGEDPSRYNPEGYHAHATPLHQAVCSGHVDVVRLLVEHGARLDIRDKIYDATPLGWAIHGQPAIAEYLRGRA